MKIQTRISLILLVIVLTIMTGFGTRSSVAEYRKGRAAMQTTRDSITARLAMGLADPLWKYNNDSAFDLMTIEMERSVIAIAVTQTTGDVLGLVREGSELVHHEPSQEEIPALVGLEPQNVAEVKLGEELLAKVELYYTDKYFEEDVRRQISGTIVEILVIAALAAISGWFAARLISKPIRLVTEGARLLSEGDVTLDGMDLEQLRRMSGGMRIPKSMEM